MAGSYRYLKVWQAGIELAQMVYQVTQNFPAAEQYGLTSQLRRAATSISANIAEGSGRQSTKEFIQFVSIAYGSTCEIETHLLIAGQLGYLREEDNLKLQECTASISRMLKALRRSLQEKLQFAE